MKHLKLFENFESTVRELNRLPKRGDFIQLKLDDNNIRSYKDLVNNNIGEVVELKQIFNLIVKYDDKYYVNSDTSHIVDFAPTKEELEFKLKARKYNI